MTEMLAGEPSVQGVDEGVGCRTSVNGRLMYGVDSRPNGLFPGSCIENTNVRLDFPHKEINAGQLFPVRPVTVPILSHPFLF